MWRQLERLLARSRTLSSALGDVVFETPPLRGQSRHSLFQWRLKKGLDGTSLFVAFKLLPDTYAGPEGTPTNYISFDIATAERLRADLDLCIDEYHRLSGAVT
jgi:hypothetical protein